ncbi:hypothetical protein [Halobaculum gomorrense]|uniref:Uncharacterized protein n=1 Tax=Halobaculum gomorrense TaxID=43928 RepID=A0A1M5RG85_9EURY|nr:hypothetical protein [Halobaculum gomorrense]SHH25140.1 hypothetical protein SAMN05443636_2179 [Halobaculum gomorrense]
MDALRLLAEYPLQVLLGAATAAAVIATLAVAAGGSSLSATLRLAALATVLLVFTLGFSAGPLAERYV